MDFKQLEKEIKSCTDCEELFGFPPKPIFWGRKDSKIMQISQAPSVKVYNTGLPFNDASGKKLRSEWYEIEDEVFYNKKNFYITSVGHCYPGKNKSGKDRTPPKSCAKKWMMEEIEVVKNEIYLIVGKNASDFFFPKTIFSELVFKDLTLNGKPVYVLPHPSPLNIKWLKDHPEFLGERMPFIRKKIHNILKIT